MTESHRLLRGTLAIQAATVVSVLAFLAVATVLGRRLSLAEFGVYGLALSFAAYAAFLQGSLENAAVRAMAEARDDRERDRAFTITALAYAAAGVAAGIVVAGVGTLLLALFDISDSLASEGRKGLLALGLLLAVSWILRSYHDALQGMQRFAASAIADSIGYALFAGLVSGLALGGAPLWIVIAAGGTPMLFSGLICAVAARRAGLHFHVRRSLLSKPYVEEYRSLALNSLAVGGSDLVITQLDRAVLAAFTNAATIGLYEATVRPQLLVRQLHGTLSATVLPASTGYVTLADEARTKELALRGTRYVLGVVVPLAVFVAVMAGPLLDVWLGARYVEAQWALTIFVAYWIFGANTGVLGSMMYAHGKAGALARIAWLIAGANLIISLALTPLIGLEGVVVGTTGAYLLLFPAFLRLCTRTLGLHVRELAEVAWRPVYPAVVVLAAVLALARLLLDDAAAQLLVGAGALAVTYAYYVLVAMDASERATFKSVLTLRR